MKITKYKVYEKYDSLEGVLAEEFDSLTEALRFRASPTAVIINEGLTMAEERLGQWDLTSEGLKAECDRFASGTWQMELPTLAGTYAVASRDGELAGLRYLVVVKGVLRDPSNTSHKTEGSDWQGWWWSEAHPELPNAPDGTVKVEA